ncbi:MAG: TauD/TfdA family dioxygenase [Proteobacteria bacterium]|nr:TauD/TfdA family dioxygenase [Pseudomonadota bacterium]
MSLTIQPTGAACGATVTGLDLAAPLDQSLVRQLREAWLQHHVLIFPDQQLTDDDLERYTQYFGDFGEDPFIAPIAGRKHVIAVSRRADEKAPIFAEVWHSDWSFQQTPPAGTCLYGITIPPHGGDTGFINQHLALARMPAALRQKIEGRQAVHSARSGYSPAGLFGNKEQEADRSMDIIVSEDAMATQTHPLVRRHPETGEEGLFGCIGYIIGIEGMPDDEARDLLMEVYQWQTRPEFQYQHQWSEQMLVMWDNRSVLHTATGGYEGYDRLLHRTTVSGRLTSAN